MRRMALAVAVLAMACGGDSSSDPAPTYAVPSPYYFMDGPVKPGVSVVPSDPWCVTSTFHGAPELRQYWSRITITVSPVTTTPPKCELLADFSCDAQGCAQTLRCCGPSTAADYTFALVIPVSETEITGAGFVVLAR